MKDKIKLIIVFIIGIILSAVISVYAATVIAASEVSYTSNGNTTVEAGLNNLYTKANGLANRVTALEGKTLKIQTGANSTVGNGAWCHHNVTFSPAYTSAPLVSIMPTTLFSTENIVISNLTKNGFTYYVYCSSNTFTYSTTWQAVGY